MNKLYKYLPFDILLSDNKWIYKLVGVTDEYFICEELLSTNIFNFNERQFKPILRPFEDLTKELPLTKAAAEMIGGKEGDLFKVVEYLDEDFQLELRRYNKVFFSSKQERDLDFLRAMHFNLDFEEDEYIKLED